MTSPSAPDPAVSDLTVERIADMVFQAIQSQMVAQLQASLGGIHKNLESTLARAKAQEEGLAVVMACIEQLERLAQGPCELCHLQQVSHVPRINLLEVYNGKSKHLVDQFT